MTQQEYNSARLKFQKGEISAEEFWNCHVEFWRGVIKEDWTMEQQKKPYIPPTTAVIETKPEEPIACSYYEHSGKPGHGWGDKNHDHYGPPGQNKKHGITDIWEDL